MSWHNGTVTIISKLILNHIKGLLNNLNVTDPSLNVPALNPRVAGKFG